MSLPAAKLADYQFFDLSDTGEPINVHGRMAAKLAAIPLPDVQNRSVLDIGCDMGFWSYLAASRGASKIIGLDRNRDVKGQGQTDLVELNNKTVAAHKELGACAFHRIDIGKQWHCFGQFDIGLCLSLYHHIYANCGDHESIWFWFWLQIRDELIWENPSDLSDPVAYAHIPTEFKANYAGAPIFKAAQRYFNIEFVDTPEYCMTRDIYSCYWKECEVREHEGIAQQGSGGASKAWEHAEGRRCDEFEHAIGCRPLPGSLNVTMMQDFHWNEGYFRVQMLDVESRENGLLGNWFHRWARIYPCSCNDQPAYAFRFEGEHYPLNFVELISPIRLRDHVNGDRVTIRTYHGNY